ncbi:MAG: TSUP family transporter, partial [Actinomycetes bacterium]
GRARSRRTVVLKTVVAATVVGLMTGFFGVGGGFVVIPALVLALGFDMPTAVGTSLLVIVINTVSSLGARASSGLHMSWPTVLVFTGSAMVAALAGTKVSATVPSARLAQAFAVLIILVAVYTAARSVPHLF